jgi:uridine phosphorylase
LVAEQLFASGCELLVNIASAGQITNIGRPPYYILIERALRDEGTSYHYLPPSAYVEADPALVELAARAFGCAGRRVHRGATWTTDAPFRETAEAIELRRREGILAVEMEAAALYAFAAAWSRPVICLAHVSNRLGCVEGDFEKGEGDGASSSLELAMMLAAAWVREAVGHVAAAE